VIELLENARSTLLFTNVRSQTEAWYQAIVEARPDWIDQVALHHGSLDREMREYAERELAAGKLRCVVCTSSLDLGVDFSAVDQVLQVGSPKGVARLLQRAGRSGHAPGQTSRLTFIPAHALELVEIAAARDAIAAGQIEDRRPPVAPLDVLAQHLITLAAGGGFEERDLFDEVRTTRSYANLSEVQWQWVLDFVTRGGAALGNYAEYRKVIVENGRYVIADQKIAQRHRMSIGTISGDQSITVKYMTGRSLGTIEESFISKLAAGSRFVFAGKTLELIRVKDVSAYVRKSNEKGGLVPRWMGVKMSFSTQLASAVRAKLEEARHGIYKGHEMQAVEPVLSLQAQWSVIPARDELLIEYVVTREGHHLFFFPFEGRLVHDGLSALCALRISRVKPLSLTMTTNDYGFEMLCPHEVPIEEAIEQDLFSPENLTRDIPASLNAAAMAKRQFREVARVAGLVFTGYPGRTKTARQMQVSSELLFDVLARYDPGNLLLHQAQQEVLESNLEQSRLQQVLERLSRSRVTILRLKRPTPMAFPLLADRFRGASLSSESVVDRIRRMQVSLEKEAG
jgi:ATP-dependent Lhr-like helicase